MLTPKRSADSLTHHVQIVLPGDLNGYGRLFGGRLMQWIDIVAGVVARRHAGREVTTASVDHLDFQAAAYVNDTIALEGRITYVGRTSMEVRVDTYVEGREVTTASVDHLDFQAAAYVNDTIALEGRITYVGRTSMEVRVDTYVESLNGDRCQVNRAYLVLVALDPENHRPAPVPPLLLETEEDYAEWEAAAQRDKIRKARR